MTHLDFLTDQFETLNRIDAQAVSEIQAILKGSAIQNVARCVELLVFARKKQIVGNVQQNFNVFFAWLEVNELLQTALSNEIFYRFPNSDLDCYAETLDLLLPFVSKLQKDKRSIILVVCDKQFQDVQLHHVYTIEEMENIVESENTQFADYLDFDNLHHNNNAAILADLWAMYLVAKNWKTSC